MKNIFLICLLIFAASSCNKIDVLPKRNYVCFTTLSISNRIGGANSGIIFETTIVDTLYGKDTDYVRSFMLSPARHINGDSIVNLHSTPDSTVDYEKDCQCARLKS